MDTILNTYYFHNQNHFAIEYIFLDRKGALRGFKDTGTLKFVPARKALKK